MWVRLSESAEAELEEIGNFIASDSPTRAASFVRELLEQCNRLAALPSRHPVVVIVNGREIRRYPYERYLIFYVVDDSGLQIAHIFHSSRDYLRLLFPDD